MDHARGQARLPMPKNLARKPETGYLARIDGMADARLAGLPLGIVVESPAGPEMTADFEALVRELAGPIRIRRTSGSDAALAAGQLARALGRDPRAPAWLDEVPGIELRVRRTGDGNARETDRDWMPMVPSDEAIPAGETYHSRPSNERRASLAPGIEHVHLHLRRGRRALGTNGTADAPPATPFAQANTFGWSRRWRAFARFRAKRG